MVVSVRPGSGRPARRGRRVRRAALALLACAAAMAFSAEQASACSCVEVDDDSIGKREVALVAKLTAVEPADGVPFDRGVSEAPSVYRYRVIEVLKGKKRIRKPRIRVYSYPATCALDARVGRRSGLILQRRNGLWLGGACGQTTPRELRELFRDKSARPLCA